MVMAPLGIRLPGCPTKLSSRQQFGFNAVKKIINRATLKADPRAVPEFTPKQLAAIDISRLGHDACIIAGPGSGKTTVLVERYRQLVENGVAPRDILAITFTEKAAANMKDKMARAFAAQPDVRRQIEAAYISTVHGFCQRLLKE